ncbi:MAG: type II toxin-antitoxin system RelE/ParE family toxin [Proteobacteria bacterium]|nr:type II toxin-antitoxin system RelE/ParE family toxin [Pseudomonadota bacterium]
MGQIKWNRKALKQLMKLQLKTRKVIIAAVEKLPTSDGWRNVKQLTDHNYQYRLRVGRYRVFFDLEMSELRIYLIQEVKKRDDRTY